MEKFETEGWVPKTWGDGIDKRINGLWSIVEKSIVYKKGCNPDVCEVFGIDIVSYDVLSAIVKKNVNAEKIVVRECHCLSDIQKILSEAGNPELIVHAGSNFAIVLAEAEHGLDLWVWDLRTLRKSSDLWVSDLSTAW